MMQPGFSCTHQGCECLQESCSVSSRHLLSFKSLISMVLTLWIIPSPSRKPSFMHANTTWFHTFRVSTWRAWPGSIGERHPSWTRTTQSQRLNSAYCISHTESLATCAYFHMHITFHWHWVRRMSQAIALVPRDWSRSWKSWSSAQASLL